MTKTLHAISVTATLLTGLMIAVIAGPGVVLRSGAGGDRQIERFLNDPSALDRFRQQRSGKDQDHWEGTPPLVEHARLLAGILHPPAPEHLTEDTHDEEPPPPPPTLKFSVEGTSCSPGPNASFAYVRLIDKTCRWVRPGEHIDTVLVEEIQNGSITCRDGRHNLKMALEPAARAADPLEAKTSSVPAPRPSPSRSR
jgi:hypothetical protein